MRGRIRSLLKGDRAKVLYMSGRSLLRETGEPGRIRMCSVQGPVRGMLKMKINKRYSGLILFLAFFLAFRPAPALCVQAAETVRRTEQRTEQRAEASQLESPVLPVLPVLPVSEERLVSAGNTKTEALRDLPERGDRILPAGHDDSDGKEASGKTSKNKFELPQFIKDYHFDAETEKKRLAEAISKLDELGFSPEKLAERFWSIISRKENREKIGKAAEDLKENTGKLIEKASGAGAGSESGKEDSGKAQSQKGTPADDKSQSGEPGKDGSGKDGSGDSQSGKDSSVQIKKSEDIPLYEKAAGGVDRVKEKVREEASKKVEEAIDQAAEAAGDYAVKEINEAAEKVKEEVR